MLQLKKSAPPSLQGMLTTEQQDFSRWREVLKYVGTSALLIVPCFWQQRIAAGDLASHAYNAWLAELVRQGNVQGVQVTWQFTNIAFDLLLSWVGRMFGLSAAQRLVTAAVVLVFFWSAFYLASVIGRKRPWFVVPLLAVVTYGSVFNQGLLNYYLGTGLALAGLALLWRVNLWRAIAAVVILVIAWLAQALPVMFAVGAFLYVTIARSLSRTARVALWIACVLILLAISYLMITRWGAVWSMRQLLHITGADQSWMFGWYYRFISLAMLVLWVSMFWRLAQQQGWIRSLNAIPLHLYGLCVAGAALLPSAILFPWYKAWFGGISDRIGLIASTVLIAYLARTRPAVWIRTAALAIAFLYFPMMYVDTRAINAMEDKVDQLVSQLGFGSRVFATDLYYPPGRGFYETMMVDRACIGRCFSFGNYEPRTLQFRVRATPGNSTVVWTKDVSVQQQFFHARPNGTLYHIYGCGEDMSDVCMEALVGGRAATVAGHPKGRTAQ